MKYAICSDVQGNYKNLHGFLTEISGKADRIICLGDIVQNGMNFEDNRCIADIIKNNVLAVKGNHEEDILSHRNAIEKIFSSNLDFISNIPSRRIIEGKYLLNHSSIRSKNKRLKTVSDVEKEFEALKTEYPGTRVCFFGHSHKASLFEYNGKISEIKDVFEKPALLKDDKVYLANPGGIGLYYDIRLSYILFDSDKQTLKFERFRK